MQRARAEQLKATPSTNLKTRQTPYYNGFSDCCTSLTHARLLDCTSL